MAYVFHKLMLVALFFLPLLSGVAFSQEKDALTTLDKHKFSVIVYDRIKGEDQSGDISPYLVKEHILEYSGVDYNVAPLDDLLDSLHNSDPLPPRSLALTFTGPNQAALRTVFADLIQKNLPFTIFVAPTEVSSGFGDSITWEQISDLISKDVEVGLLLKNRSGKNRDNREDILNELDSGIAVLAQKTGEAPKYVSYPARGVSPVMRTLVASRNIGAAFDRQSGPVHALSDFFDLPRFTMTDAFGTIERLRLATDSLPLPVADVLPSGGPVVNENPPLISFSIPEGYQRIRKVICYLSGHGKLPVETIAGLRVEIRIQNPLKSGYHRVNCTASSRSGNWRWYARRIYIP